jgi:hypothetical protein
MTPPSPAAKTATPEWLAHRYEPGLDAVHFLPLSRADRAAATFLTDEYLGERAPALVIRREEALQAAPAAAPLHYILHSAFCGSTVLNRAFDIPGGASSLSEPPILNDLVGWRYRDAPQGAQLARVLDGTLALLAKPFEHGEAVVLKPSNIAVGLYDAMLAMRPQAKALLLYAPLPIYLRSIVKKGVDGRMWVRDLLTKLLRERLIDVGMDGEDYLRLTDLQAAAVGWIAQHMLFARLGAKYPDRVRTLDSETLMARPADVVARLADLYGLPVDAGAVAQGPAFTRHSKHGGAFDPAARTAEYAAAADAHGDELGKVEVWAQHLAKGLGVTLDAPATPLL